MWSLGNVSDLFEYIASRILSHCKHNRSPLNAAFYSGHVETVRLLLRLKAELDYVNCRKWASVRYVYDPQLTKMNTIELLDICAARGFDQWDTQDAVGWTIFHRASAFGRERDLKKLRNLRASSDIITSKLNWLPIFCSIKFGNESTFKFLVDLIYPLTLPTLKDSRGWTLLHLAAESGSEAIMTQLLQRKLDPLAITDESTVMLPEGLCLRELTAGDVASFFNNQDAYQRALQNAGLICEPGAAG
jgi:ankyrin repeat protein